ncbi:ATP-binding protein, partial [Desulfobacterales bacterium HSG16]|nr:ATP-binding protein [Desulfobacterales bacterium HSG16]
PEIYFGHVVLKISDQDLFDSYESHLSNIFIIISMQLENMRYKREIKASEKKYRDLYENSPDMLFSIDAETENIFDCNKTAAETLGYQKKEIIGLPVSNFYEIESSESIKNNFAEFLDFAMTKGGELQIQKNDGTSISVSLNESTIKDKNGKIIHRRLSLRDISQVKKAKLEKAKLEKQLLQSQKMESIGTLASGVAHEINNPVNGIMNYAQLIKDKIDSGSPLVEYASEIIYETNRVTTIVRNLLTFARQDRIEYSPARLKDIIDQTLSLIRTVLRKNQINLELIVPEDLPLIKCRSQQIQQVLMNLITNARDALNEKYPGYDENKKIEISSSLFQKDGRELVRITVYDKGIGINSNVSKNLFDPFYTTKGRAVGTGLGLSISFGIIRDHHGELSFESEPGKYTKFHIDLPVVLIT